MAIAKKYHYKHKNTLRDLRTPMEKLRDFLLARNSQVGVFVTLVVLMFLDPYIYYGADVYFILGVIYFFCLKARGHTLPSKMPLSAQKEGLKDPNNDGPGKNKKPEGILYVGNTKDTKEEIWFTSSDIKTHILYLGTTGAGKTEGLKSLVANALCWGSGYVYVDGKADTGLWSSLSAQARRFGRDDDLLVLNYMTGNKDGHGASNTLNPFAGGSASYLTNLMVSLMPDAGGDNAMWKERAVALIGSVLPALTWRRDFQEFPLNVGTIREYLNLPKIISLSRNPDLPEKIKSGIRGYLDTLPGYVDEAFDDDGNEKPMPPDAPMVDTSTIHQQHGYLSMQFTRSLQSLADDYGYVFETEAADIDMTDVVLNRRMLVVLIPALEKSSDEAANLGKIVAATIKGMMGSTLGADVEGAAETTIDNKPSESKTPFMTIFDEVGYYASQGMAVMAAQARSLGFCLVYAAQDLPAMEKRVKEEARSITANCNVKIFGKLEDPTQTKEFFEKTVGDVLVAEVSGFQANNNSLTGGYSGKGDASVQSRSKASYDGLRSFKEGDAVVTFGGMLEEINVFYSNPGDVKAMRVQKMLEPPKPDEAKLRQKPAIITFLDNYRRQDWTAANAAPAVATEKELTSILDGFKLGKKAGYEPLQFGILGIASLGEMFMDNYPELQKTVAPVAAATTSAAVATAPEIETSSVSPVASGSQVDEGSDDSSFSWGDLMGGGDETSNESDDSAMSWSSFSSNDESPASEGVEQQPAQENVVAQQQDQPIVADDEDDGGFSWGDIAADDEEGVDQSHSGEAESSSLWADVMGEEGETSVSNAPIALEVAEQTDHLENLPVDETVVSQPSEQPVEEVSLPDNQEDLLAQISDELRNMPQQSDDAQNIDQMLEETNFYRAAQQAPQQESFDLPPANAKQDDRPEGFTDEAEALLKSTAEELSDGLSGSDNPLDQEDKK